MYTLQDLLDELDELEVDPKDVTLTALEFRKLLKRAEHFADADGEDEDG